MEYLEYKINENKKVLFVKTEHGINLVPINKNMKFKSYNKSDSDVKLLDIDPRFIYQQAYGKCTFNENLNRIDITNYFEGFYKGVDSGSIDYPLDNLLKIITDYNDYMHCVRHYKARHIFVNNIDNDIVKMQVDTYTSPHHIGRDEIINFMNIQRKYNPTNRKKYFKYSVKFITEFVERIVISFSDISDICDDIYDFMLYLGRNYNNGERQLIISKNIKLFEAVLKLTTFFKYNVPCNLFESYHILLHTKTNEVAFENMSREIMLNYMVENGFNKERIKTFYSKSYRLKPHNGTDLDARILQKIVESGDLYIYELFANNNGDMHVEDILATVNIMRKCYIDDDMKQMLFTNIYRHSYKSISNQADELFYFDMIDRLFDVYRTMIHNPELIANCFTFGYKDIDFALATKSLDQILSLSVFTPMYEAHNLIEDDDERRNFMWSLKLLKNIRTYVYNQCHTILLHDIFYANSIKYVINKNGMEQVITPTYGNNKGTISVDLKPGHNGETSGLFSDIENTTEPEDSNEGKSIFSRIKSFFTNK